MKLDVHYGHRMVGRRVAAKSCLVRIRKWLDGSRKKSRNALPLSTNKKKAQATAGSNASILGSPPNSGRKVQAQRKFAQGAIVPHSNNVPDRRRDVTPREDQGHRLGQNTMVKMHAKNLLDVVAFKNMHSHLQPFVLLKRLPESSVENGNQSAEKERGPESSNSATMTPGLYKRLARTKQLANMKTKQMHTMKLRSRQVQQPKNVIKNNKRKLEPPPPTRAKRRRVMQPSISEYSVDDYKPLTYFTTRQTPPVTRSKPRPPLPGRAGATVKTKVKDNSKSKTPAPVPSTATKHNEKMVTTDGDNVMIADEYTETEPVTLEAPVTQADLEPNTNSSRKKPTPRAVRLEQRKIPKRSSSGPGPSVSKNTPIGHTDAQSNLVVMSDVSMPSTNGTTMPRLHETDNYRPESVISNATDTQAGESTSFQEDCVTDLDAQSSRASTSNRPFANSIENVVSLQSEVIPDTPEPPKERETRSSEATKTNNKTTFPRSLEGAKCVDAPVFYPTEEEFQDPIAYFDKIMPAAAKFGLCKIVAPAGFKPTCVSNDNIRFNVMNQYVARMYSRWGPAQREMSAIKAYLASQSVRFIRAPLLDCMEVDLPKLYHMVQHNGGLKKVIEKKRWARVASEMRNSRNLSPGKKLDYIYVKYILPYGTLSHAERQDMMRKVDHCWYKKNQKMLDRALNPLHRQKKMLGESDSSADEEEDDDEEVNFALLESEDCVVLGRNMNLAMFKRTAANVKMVQFPRTPKPKAGDIESKYWKTVLLGTDHVCVNSASIDTGNEGYGFTKNKNDPYGKHPWNLKMVSQNPGNVLRSLGPVMGVTSPTLHLGMLYSTSCWHRDPHGLPWVEYMHTGPRKIWYGIPGEQSENFRSAVEKLCPTSCQNKSIWLPSDITMIPPNLLCEHNVSLSRVTQEPGTFIIVFPKAYSCSIATGYTQSESVYFATSSWLDSVHHIFQELRQSCEPTMFSLEQLLMSVAKDSRVSLRILQKVHSHLSPIVNEELANRRTLAERGVKFTNTESRNRKPNTCRRPRWNSRGQDECEICRTTLYFSMVTNTAGKRICLCLQHALQLMDAPKQDSTTVYEVVTVISDAELQTTLANVQKRLSL
ncbi:protein Jumonji isoform X3 [Manduca sexta]|uniref:protein Jumonji isoform X3 n=1 Tax=Manduca sexta TaxID=7130 RepID=UPI00189006B6|nr:protein Jumonji isoform X3 [Manduca sexta]